MPSVLFVCKANQYRSPLAKAFFQRELEQRNMLSGWIVESAGTWAQPGLQAALSAQKEATRLGISLEGHLTREVETEFIQRFDLVLAMEAGQVEAMEAEFPSMAGKIFLLAKVTNEFGYDIPDPALVQDNWQMITTAIEEIIKQGFAKIVALAEEKSVRKYSNYR